MSAGTAWTYRGIVRSGSGNSGGIETKIEWKMEVRHLIHHGEYTAALISGFPDDLNWSEGPAKPTNSLLVRFGSDTFYRLSDPNLTQAVRRFDNPEDSLAGLFTDDDLFLKLPLAQGSKFCDPEGMARDDGEYCWLVESKSSITLEQVIGAPKGSLTSYTLRYVTNPDDISFDFVPGIGIISYEYHHHGTVADTELKLVEFHPAPSHD